MTDPLMEPEPPRSGEALAQALDIRALGRQARAHQISANALLTVGSGLAVFASALLLWGGIVEGPARAVLLLIAAALMPARLMVNRLSAVTLSDGVAGSTRSALRRGLHHGEASLLILAGGLSVFGSAHGLGAALSLAGALLGAAGAVLALLGGLRGPARTGFVYGLYPSLILGAAAAVAAFEPLWGWRGQSLLIGLSAIAAVLTVQLLRRRPGA